MHSQFQIFGKVTHIAVRTLSSGDRMMRLRLQYKSNTEGPQSALASNELQIMLSKHVTRQYMTSLQIGAKVMVNGCVVASTAPKGPKTELLGTELVLISGFKSEPLLKQLSALDDLSDLHSESMAQAQEVLARIAGMPR